ncbi:MAG: helix-turn-helix transcriptional regulator [Sandarakinorhabdus sp.]|nr:helix-turn-helix transcriptional regulator [Sandarakinorhabdus sp.]
MSDRISPQQWGAMLAAAPPPLLAIDGGLIRRWSGTAATMEQPPLDHHYLAQHLGGPKQVRRQGEGGTITSDVAPGSVTAVPAGASFHWRTRGPIEFTHLYIAPRRLDRTIRETFDRDPRGIDVLPQIGWEDPLVTVLLTAICDPALDAGPDGRLARDSWFEALLARIVHNGSTLSPTTQRARNALAPRTLARLKAHIEANLAHEVTLDSLAEVAGLSRFHLCRAFRETTGFPPHAWLTRTRIAAARRLLRGGDQPIHEIARQCGFASPSQFATSFRKVLGVPPSAYRRSA